MQCKFRAFPTVLLRLSKTLQDNININIDILVSSVIFLSASQSPQRSLKSFLTFVLYYLLLFFANMSQTGPLFRGRFVLSLAPLLYIQKLYSVTVTPPSASSVFRLFTSPTRFLLLPLPFKHFLRSLSHLLLRCSFSLVAFSVDPGGLQRIKKRSCVVGCF